MAEPKLTFKKYQQVLERVGIPSGDAAKLVNDWERLASSAGSGANSAPIVVNNNNSGGGSNNTTINVNGEGGSVFIATNLSLPVNSLVNVSGSNLSAASCNSTSTPATHVVVAVNATGIFIKALVENWPVTIMPGSNDDGTGIVYLYRDGQATLSRLDLQDSDGFAVGDARIVQTIGTVNIYETSTPNGTVAVFLKFGTVKEIQPA